MVELGLLYLGMGVSGGEEGDRHGPSLMLGGSFEAYKYVEDTLLKVAAQVPNSGPCVTYIGKGGSGNFIKMAYRLSDQTSLIGSDDSLSGRRRRTSRVFHLGRWRLSLRRR